MSNCHIFAKNVAISNYALPKRGNTLGVHIFNFEVFKVI